MNPSGPSPAASLPQESSAARALIELLKKEQAMLIAADMEALPELTTLKNNAVAQLSELATRRYQALGVAGFAQQEAGMQAWLKNASPSVMRDWETLRELAQQAKELNRVNGMLINRHLSRNQEALNVLRQGNAHDNHTFYGPNGQSSVKTTVRGLAIG